MKNGFKIGLGLVLGEAIGKVIIALSSTFIDRWFMKTVNDDTYMAALEIRNPDLYKRLLKYRKEE